MAIAEDHRSQRRQRNHAASRAAILDAARRVAERDGARELSLRGVAAEAGYAPAALYGYFRNKDELLLALAADDLAVLAKSMREPAQHGQPGLHAAAAAALDLLMSSETIAAAQGALAAADAPSDAERHFNGRLIAVLTSLADAAGRKPRSREEQADIVLLAAALSGLALLARSGRLAVLGFAPDEMLRRLDAAFGVKA